MNPQISNNNYFIMRHGQALFNARNIIDSHGDESNHLTEIGIGEIRESISKFKKQNPKIDLIIHSPFIRTTETANFSAELLGVDKANVIANPLIKEIDTGIFHKKDPKIYHDYFSSLEEKFTKTPPEGENLSDLKKRMMQFMEETESQYKNKTILIISHEYPLWILDTALMGLDNHQSAEKKLQQKDDDYIHTAEIRKLTFERLPANVI